MSHAVTFHAPGSPANNLFFRSSAVTSVCCFFDCSILHPGTKWECVLLLGIPCKQRGSHPSHGEN
jgi:hypothetical protein